MLPGDAPHFIQAHQRYLHFFVMLPEIFRHPQGGTFCHLRIPIGDHKTIRLQCRHIGKRIADEHSGGETVRPLLHLLRHADALAK